jgi:hypothetical protein
MCEYCEALHSTKEREKLEYIGTRVVSYSERYYYRCPQCDQAFYWLDWFEPSVHHLEIMTVNASDIMVLFQE